MSSTICCRKILAALVCCLALGSCQKEYSIIDELGVLQHTLNVSSAPGFTHITVYAGGDWTLSLDKHADWASLNKMSGTGLGDFRLSWAGNFGVARDVSVIINSEGKEETIHVIQAGAITSPYMNLGISRIVLPSKERSFEIPMTTNLGFCLDEFSAKAVYYGAEGAVPDTLEVGSEGSKAWISAFKVESDKVSFSALANASGADRRADVIYYMRDAAGQETRATVSVTQSASGPVFVLPEPAVSYYANSSAYVIPAGSNNIWSLPETAVSADVPWISSMAVTEEGLSFAAEENRSGAARSGKITVTSPGLEAPVVLSVSQAPYKLLSFEEIRGRVPGVINSTDKLEGIIISDPSSPNLCSSIQTGQFAFDRTENYRTAYLESVDGRYGLCLKFNKIEDNVYARGTRILITLNGVNLSRETAPMRYTLSGLTPDRIEVLEENAEIPLKERFISQLSDTDIFTWVSVQNVEILNKDGSYTNVSEGYTLADKYNPMGAVAPRVDVAPLMCTDPEGNSIFMLTNCAAPWRRSRNSDDDMAFFNLLPQGAGTLNGVLVSDAAATVRWGSLGKYQIRPMQASDVDLNHEGDRFSNIICEWTWNSLDEKSMSPDEGKGTLRTYEAGRSFGEDYNNPYLPQDDAPSGGDPKTNIKGLVSQGALNLINNWWDFETDEGRYFDIEFITTGLSGTNLVFGITWGHGLGNTSSIYAPSNWNVLYSTDGTTFTKVGSIKQRYCAWWITTSQDATPGFTEHLVKLPGSCFNQGKVIVRIQAADRTTDMIPSTSATTWQNALGVERGIITSSMKKESGCVRIGAITVRYN